MSFGCSQAAWTTTHNATSGAANYTSAVTANTIGSGCTAANRVDISRGFLIFNTTSLPDNATISQATLYLFVTGTAYAANDSNAYIGVVQGLQTYTTSLVAADYIKAGNATTNPVEGSNRQDISKIATASYIPWNLNQTGLTWISRTGYTKLALREGHDIANQWPGYLTNSGNYITVYLSEQPGAFQDPYLEVIYTAP